MKSYDELKAEMETIQQQMVEAKSIIVTPSGQACGATVTNVDLSQHLSPATVGEIRAAWLAHHVVAFPNQSLSDDDLERFSQYFGEFGEDPFIAPIPNREHIIAVKRMAHQHLTLARGNDLVARRIPHHTRPQARIAEGLEQGFDLLPVIGFLVEAKAAFQTIGHSPP